MDGINVTEYDEYIELHENIRVINFLAAWGMSDESIIENANHNLPAKLFDKLVAKNKPFTWIQISSYFHFFYLENTLDKDIYSYWKRIFSSYINQVSEANSFINIIEIFLPHLYGENDKNNRLISTLTKFKESDQSIELSSGRQFIPILKVDDCAKALYSILTEDELNSSSNQIYIKETEQFTIKELVLTIKKHQPLEVVFGRKLERKNEFYNKIHSPFPNYIIKNPVTLHQYMLSIRKDKNE
jgi:nucleoside-diphosphate-sugar epimerase